MPSLCSNAPGAFAFERPEGVFACPEHRHDQHRRTLLPGLGQYRTHPRGGRCRLHAGGQVPPHPGPHLPERGAGAGPAAADAEAARRTRRAGYRRLHLRLPRFAAGRLRPRVVAGQEAARVGQGEVPARPQRGPGRDHGLGHPAAGPVPGRDRRWRVRHVVRQGPGRGPLRRRLQACQCRGHVEARRRAGVGCGRPQLPQLDLAAWQRTRIRQRDDAGAQPGRRAGHPRPGPARFRDVALHRPLGRLQDDRRDGGILRFGRCRSVRDAGRAARRRRLRDARRRPQHPLAGSAAGPGDAPASLRGQGRAGVRARQRHRPHRHRFGECAARHRHHRQELPGRAAGAGIPGPGRCRMP